MKSIEQVFEQLLTMVVQKRGYTTIVYASPFVKRIIDSRLRICSNLEADFSAWSKTHEVPISLQKKIKAIVKRQKAYPLSTPIYKIYSDFKMRKRGKVQIAREELRYRLPSEQNSRIVSAILHLFLHSAKTDREYVAKLMCRSESQPDLMPHLLEQFEMHPDEMWLGRAALKHASSRYVQIYEKELLECVGAKDYTIRMLRDDENYSVSMDEYSAVDYLEIYSRAGRKVSQAAADALTGKLMTMNPQELDYDEQMARACSAFADMGLKEYTQRLYDVYMDNRKDIEKVEAENSYQETVPLELEPLDFQGNVNVNEMEDF